MTRCSRFLFFGDRVPGILRRKVIEAEKSAPEIAREAIEMMRALYVAEKNARYSSIAERLDLRQKQSAQVLVQLRQKLLT